MKPRLVLVGAGHAHLGAFEGLSRLVEDGYPVTVISRDPVYCYSGMAPGVLGGIYEPADMSLDVGSIVRDSGARFLPREVVRIDPRRRRLVLDDDTAEPYDVASFNIGSDIPIGGMELDSATAVVVKPINHFCRVRDRLEELFGAADPVRVLIAGGGPAGLEIAANVVSLARLRGGSVSVTIVTSGRFMRMLSPPALSAAKDAMARGDVAILEDRRLRSAVGGTARLDDGEEREVDLAVVAVGVRPAGLFRDSGLPTAEDGGLLVDDRLRSPSFPEIFASGDCASMTDRILPRIGAVACRQNPVIAKNVVAALTGGRLCRFRPRRRYLQIFNLGEGRGLIVRGGLSLEGRLAFRLKDSIDRRFIRRLRKALPVPD